MPICCVFWSANGWSSCSSQVNIIFLGISHLFLSRMEKRKSAIAKWKIHKKGLPALGATPKSWQTPPSWLTTGKNYFLLILQKSATSAITSATPITGTITATDTTTTTTIATKEVDSCKSQHNNSKGLNGWKFPVISFLEKSKTEKVTN